ncbi:EamA family transporter [Corynebacterium sp. ES2794-CONJ1]|uniref:EamA family transporter n=1 Tax=unclassified Corynebacterium TaxID=2624378 RepID=UPI00216A4815|nr:MULTISPECIES: EamA family transporter [unclassified Corynebacterium]MCS4491428.1 EamA family transporter [Corynebacterium sp. ES2715-CONJ3]MCS4531471.1 EamA family transporter [Corynebacterium sp. ES2730-CONJ]MCU9518859.1 EamA family transporter [Corynebacterium sp. ES2794-CONJ1]
MNVLPRLHIMAPAARRPRLRPLSLSGAWIGITFVILAIISLQLGSALATQLFSVAGTWGTAFYRLGIAGTLLLAITRPKILKWNRTQWTHVIALGIALSLMNGFFYSGLARIPLGTAVTIEFLGPLSLAALLSRRAKDFLWVGLAVVGIGIFGLESFFSSASLDGLGLVFILLAAFFWALYIVASAKVGQHINGTGGLAVALIIGAIPAAPQGLANISTVVSEPVFIGYAIATALLASLIPYSLEFIALRSIPSATFGVLMSLEPVVAAIMGWLLLKQNISALGLIAIACVITASIGATRTTKKPRVVDDQPEEPIHARKTPA